VESKCVIRFIQRPIPCLHESLGGIVQQELAGVAKRGGEGIEKSPAHGKFVVSSTVRITNREKKEKWKKKGELFLVRDHSRSDAMGKGTEGGKGPQH